MQIAKEITGSFTDVAGNGNLCVNYGTSATTNVLGSAVATHSVRDQLADIVEKFLKNDCGVNVRRIQSHPTSAGTISCVVIFGVPISFVPVASATKDYTMQYKVGFPMGNGFELPTSTPALSSGQSGAPSTVPYKFSLVFTGNPESAFVLRLVNYGASATNTMELFIAKGVNLVSERDAVVFSYAISSTGKLGSVHYANLKDTDDGQLIDLDTYSYSDTVTLSPVLETTEADAEAVGNRIPLIHNAVKFISMNDVYVTPRNFGLPTPATNTVISQPEFIVGDRKFIQTANSTGAVGSNSVSAPIGVGMIDVSNDPEPEPEPDSEEAGEM